MSRMKFNKSYQGATFEDYVTYLQTIKNRVPEELFDFISDPQRHDLGEKSLHDSRIKKIEYENTSEGKYEMSLVLVGANRTFKIYFANVSQLRMHQANFGDIYKDLITYEVGIEKDIFKNENLVFRAKFPFEEGIIEVYSEKIEIREESDLKRNI